MLKSYGKDFKEAILKMLQQAIMNMLEENGKKKIESWANEEKALAKRLKVQKKKNTQSSWNFRTKIQ